VATVAGVSPAEWGIASGLNNAACQLGGAFGSAALATAPVAQAGAPIAAPDAAI
jgi:hypothetical protein